MELEMTTDATLFVQTLAQTVIAFGVIASVIALRTRRETTKIELTHDALQNAQFAVQVRSLIDALRGMQGEPDQLGQPISASIVSAAAGDADNDSQQARLTLVQLLEDADLMCAGIEKGIYDEASVRASCASLFFGLVATAQPLIRETRAITGDEQAFASLERVLDGWNRKPWYQALPKEAARLY
jgi:hypothetical protein